MAQQTINIPDGVFSHVDLRTTLQNKGWMWGGGTRPQIDTVFIELRR